jgi:signal transduction histidine kinase
LTGIRLLWLTGAYLALYAFGFFSRPLYGAAAIWPAHALTFAVFMLLPFGRWPYAALVLLVCDLALNPLLHCVDATSFGATWVIAGLAVANILTAAIPAALARGWKLLGTPGRPLLVISPLWIVVLLLGVLPGAWVGVTAMSGDVGVPVSASHVGLWMFAAVLAIVTMGPAIFGILLGFSETVRPTAKPWEVWVVCAGLAALFLWFALAPAAGRDVLVEPMLFTIPLVWLALRFSQRTTSIAVALVAVVISVVAALRSGSEVSAAGSPAWPDVVIAIDVFLLVGCGGALLVNLMTFRQRALLDELEREHAQLRRYAQALDSAEEAARRNTAADLHDGIGQVLAGQSMTLSAMRSPSNPPRLATLIEEAVEASREAQEGLRLMIQDLSPPELENASLEEMIKWLAELFKTRFGFIVTYRIHGDSRLSHGSLQLAYRCIRELTMNACKHSGQSCVSLEISIGGDLLTLTVTDEGVGFDPEGEPATGKGRFGLAQLRERVRAAGGAVTLASARGSGCRVRVVLPR